MKDGFIKIAAACPDVKVADVISNADCIVKLAREAAALGVRVLCFPELSITGYTCGDLFLLESMLREAESALFRIAEKTKECDTLLFVGAPLRNCGKLFNCAVAICRGEILAVYAKQNMPNYAEFYELRHFSVPGGQTTIMLRGREYPFGTDMVLQHASMPGFCVAAEICEDLWVAAPPSQALAAGGATIIVNPSAGNEVIGKAQYRHNLVTMQSARLLCAYVYAGAGMGESTTDTVFSGHSLIAENGIVLDESEPFAPRLVVSEVDVYSIAHDRQRMNTFSAQNISIRRVQFDMAVTETALTRKYEQMPFVPACDDELHSRARVILQMQSYGLKKRLEHINAKTMVVGVSGGLDSTLALIVATKTADLMGLSRECIKAVTMPCFGTTARTKNNAVALCEALSVPVQTVDISESVRVHLADIGHSVTEQTVAYENAQARMRTMVLMNIANDCGGIVIGTGDLSELALGWATYNGDHMSMYGVNASIPKTLVSYIIRSYAQESLGEVKAVLEDIIDTPISPELLPSTQDGAISQRTEDLVGPYELHDFFLYYFMRFGMTTEKIFRLARRAFDGKYSDDVIKKWLNMFMRRFFVHQFKRSCLPDGVKVGSVSLSPRGDFRMPSDASGRLWQLD